MDKNKKLLSEKIKEGFESLSSMQNGSEEKSKAVDDVTKLYKLKIEEEKTEAEVQKLKIEEAKLEAEREEKKTQQKEVFYNTLINAGVQIGLAIGGWFAYDVWHKRGLKFEETGTITSPETRNLISRMLPKGRY